MNPINRLPTLERLLRGVGLFIYLAAMYIISSQLSQLSQRAALLFVTLLLSLFICLLVDAVVRAHFRLRTEFSIQKNPLALQGGALLAILFAGGYFVERNLKAEPQAVVYWVVVYFWAAAFVSVIKYFRKNK
jgi:hypothetical protein